MSNDERFDAAPDIVFEGATVLETYDGEAHGEGARRTITALVLPWNTTGNNGRKWSFAPGSVEWSEPGRVKLLDTHNSYTIESLVGAARVIEDTDAGLKVTFMVAQTPLGDLALSLAKQGILDGFSVGLRFDNYDGVVRDDSENGDGALRVTSGAKLREVSLCAIPAFDDARSISVTASAAPPKEDSMTDTTTDTTPETPATTPALPGNFAETIADAVVKGLGTGFSDMGDAIVAALQERQGPAASPPPPGRTEARPLYGEGSQYSLVRDAWNASRHSNATTVERDAAAGRQRDFSALVEEGKVQIFQTGSTTNLPEIFPTTNRQDLYVPELDYPRPIYDAVSKANITDATPFRLPKFNAASGMINDHVEGVNPTDGYLDLTDQTVTPTAVSGLFKLTREIADASNPAVDRIALDSMRRAYEEEVEARLAAMFLASGYAASGGTTGTGADLILALKRDLVTRAFARGGNRLNRIIAGQTPFTEASVAVDDVGRPLLPELAPQNADGTARVGVAGLRVSGYAMVPAWALDAALVVYFNSSSAWCFTSPVKQFRFEERNGPALIELAAFGYEAHAILRDSDVVKRRYATA